MHMECALAQCLCTRPLLSVPVFFPRPFCLWWCGSAVCDVVQQQPGHRIHSYTFFLVEPVSHFVWVMHTNCRIRRGNFVISFSVNPFPCLGMLVRVFVSLGDSALLGYDAHHAWLCAHGHCSPFSPRPPPSVCLLFHPHTPMRRGRVWLHTALMLLPFVLLLPTLLPSMWRDACTTQHSLTVCSYALLIQWEIDVHATQALSLFFCPPSSIVESVSPGTSSLSVFVGVLSPPPPKWRGSGTW